MKPIKCSKWDLKTKLEKLLDKSDLIDRLLCFLLLGLKILEIWLEISVKKTQYISRLVMLKTLLTKISNNKSNLLTNTKKPKD